ncbi:MAG TPA: rhomboid family intramembrane serine protease [Acidobacteriaceae bacterium]|nr:rhomboid family intramembrane serine protease [Acidobacteriaceae bacterium]
MPRSGSMMMSFPPFAGMVRKLILVNVAIYFLLLVLGWIVRGVASSILGLCALTPGMVTHGYLWQVVTYSFIHVGIWSIVINMLSLWFVGAYMEVIYGTRWITELYFVSVIGAALTTIVVSYTGIFHLTPMATTFGAMGGVFGLLAAFGTLMGDQEFLLFPLPISIRAKYLVLIYLLIAVAMLMQGPSGFAYLAYLGGALFGYLYAKMAPRKGFSVALSKQAYGMRNSYYRSKRQRAARKFEVYMRKHNRDVKFDDQGHYIDPDKDRDPSDRKWMN